MSSDSSRSMSRSARSRAVWLAVFVIAGVVATIGESTYDMAFADTALTVSDEVTTVGWIYFAGYLTEAIASATLGSRVDAWGPLRAMVIFSGAAAIALAAAGLTNVVLGVTSVVFIVLSAALVDYLNQLVGISHSAALPEAFGADEQGLIRFSGLDSSVRSVSSIASPVIAGLIIVQAPGFQALFVVAALYVTGYALLIGFLVDVGRRSATTNPTTSPPATGEPPPRPTLRRVAADIRASSAWRRFLVVDVIATMALSTALLLLYSLFRSDFDLAPTTAGLLLGCLALGSLLASVVIARGTKSGLSRLFGIGAVGCGAGTIVLAMSAGNVYVGGVGATVLGVGSVLQLKSMTLLVQLNAPRGQIGSWFAVIDTVERVVNALAIVAAATLMDVLGGSWVFGATGLILVACGGWWFAIQHQVRLDAPPEQQRERHVAPG
ncbi:MAG: MFS transporter [Dermatophilaceae bacterium]